MPDSLIDRLVELCEQLLALAGKEEKALASDNLEELEAYMALKQKILKELGEVEARRNSCGLPGRSEKAAELLKRASIGQERLRDGVRAMLDKCQDAILDARADRRAHQAYFKARKIESRGQARSESV